MRSTSVRQHILLPGVTLLVLVVDQLSKRWITGHLQLGESWNPVPFLRRLMTLTYVTNTGVAFGLFPGGSDLFIGVAILVVIGVLAYSIHLPQGQWVTQLTMGLILGGTTGNLLDRLVHGHVIDFIDFRVWPVFNVADSAIVVAMAILAHYLWRDQGRSG